jgi:hypothetical protein
MSSAGYPSNSLPSNLKILTPKIFFVTGRKQELSSDGMLS